MEREADVVVIGAALAGLVAGAILTRHGKRVVILDHADAVGGRGGAVERPGGWWIDFGHRDGHDVGDCQVVWHHGAEAAREAGVETAPRRGPFIPDDDQAGGMQGLMEPWARAIRACGGESALGWKAVEIVVEGGVVRGAVAVDRTTLVREVGAPAVITTYPVWENFDLLDERLFPADFVAAAHELRRHRADLVGWQAGLRRLPTIRATGRPEHHAGWNRLLWGPERVYRGGWQITSMTSRRAAPPAACWRAAEGTRASREQRQLPPRPRDPVEVRSAEKAQHRVGDRPQLLRHVVVVVGRGGRLAHRLGPGARHHVGDDPARRPGLLARRLHVRRRRLGVLGERLADRLPVGQLAVEASGAQVGHEAADEVGDRPVVEDQVEQHALEAARHPAPVTPHGLEADELDLLAGRRDHQPRVALLAPRRPAAHLGHEEARVDLLELELEVARAAELACHGVADGAADRRAQLLTARRGPRRVGLAEVDEERVGVAVDDAVAQVRDRRSREPDHVLAGGGDRVRHRGREQARGGRAEHAEEGVHQDLGRLRRDRVARRPGARALLAETRHQLWEDARLVAPEHGAAGRADDRLRPGREHVGERIDVEGADDARVEALEVEDEDVAVEPGARVEHEAAHDARPGALRRPHRGRDSPARAQRPQVERVDGRDRRAHAVELHPGREAPLDRQLHQPRRLQYLEHEARVLEG